MEVTIDDLYKMIGELLVENRVLRNHIRDITPVPVEPPVEPLVEP